MKGKNIMEETWIEHVASRMQSERSTPELHPQLDVKLIKYKDIYRIDEVWHSIINPNAYTSYTST